MKFFKPVDPQSTLTNEASEILQQIVKQGIDHFSEVTEILSQPENQRIELAKKISQKMCLGNQKMALCLGLLEPKRSNQILKRIFDIVSEYIEQLEEDKGLSGALEILEQELKFKKLPQIQEQFKILQQQSKQHNLSNLTTKTWKQKKILRGLWRSKDWQRKQTRERRTVSQEKPKNNSGLKRSKINCLKKSLPKWRPSGCKMRC